MKLNDLGWNPSEYRYGEISTLSEYDAERLRAWGVEEAWYYYAQGWYEGSGQALLRKGDGYFLADLGHCSCYGPTENIQLSGTGQSLAELRESCTAALLAEIAPLLEWAESGVKPEKQGAA